MKKLLLHITALLTLFLIAFFLGWNWFEFAMNDGWPLPPNIWGRIIGADGERAYDAHADQLGFMIFLIFALLYIAATRWRSNRRQVAR